MQTVVVAVDRAARKLVKERVASLESRSDKAEKIDFFVQALVNSTVANVLTVKNMMELVSKHLDKNHGRSVYLIREALEKSLNEMRLDLITEQDVGGSSTDVGAPGAANKRMRTA